MNLEKYYELEQEACCEYSVPIPGITAANSVFLDGDVWAKMFNC